MKTKLLLLLAFIVTLDAAANTYPISPRPLRKLIRESECIVYAHVLKIQEEETDDWASAKAILVIQEILQGSVKKDTIEVYFFPGMACPAPAVYKKGTDVLAFLDASKDGKGYTTHALSYGSKTLNAEGFAIYKKRIQEMQTILKLEDPVQQSFQTLDWLVECASNKYTRWEGVYELSPHSDFMSYYDREQDKFVTGRFLGVEHRKKLKKAFFDIETIDYHDLGLADLLGADYESEVNQFLIQQLKKRKNFDDFWYSEFIMARVAYFSKRKDLNEILERMEKVDYMSKERDQQMQELVKEFIAKL